MDNQKELFLLHARLVMLGFYTNLDRIFAFGNNHNLPSDLCSYDLSSASLTKGLKTPEVRAFFSGSDLYQWFQYIFEYGVEGIDNPDTEPKDELESCMPFWEGLKHMRNFIENNTECDIQESFDFVERVVSKYFSRLNLDCGEHGAPIIDGEPALFLTELAGLADLDEKTIRNMASKKPDGFPTLHKKDNRTYVTKAEARAWLISRGWKETVSLTKEKIPGPLPERFYNVEHVQEVLETSVRWAQTQLGKDSPTNEDWFRSLHTHLARGDLNIPFELIENWAAFINAQAFDIATMMQMTKHRLETEALLKHFEQY